jgi:hypothetical protein
MYKTAFPWAQWLRERDSVLCSTYIAHPAYILKLSSYTGLLQDPLSGFFLGVIPANILLALPITPLRAT